MLRCNILYKPCDNVATSGEKWFSHNLLKNTAFPHSLVAMHRKPGKLVCKGGLLSGGILQLGESLGKGLKRLFVSGVLFHVRIII